MKKVIIDIRNQSFFGKYKRPYTALISTSSNEAKYRLKVPHFLMAYDLEDCSKQLKDAYEFEPYSKVGFIVNGHIQDVSKL
jgi:hypothetical protein